jgi:acyl carrier protein phosphodiesterase
MADGIKGKDYKKYPEGIQKGILLHRAIDSFTDAHQTVRQSTRRLHKNYGHYSGVIVDILYDHFLAKNWSRYHDMPLEQYVEKFYDVLEDHFEHLPSRTRRIMAYMIPNNWLVSYASIDGITQVLVGMNRRTQNRSRMNLAINELEEFYEEFENEFTMFFDELIEFAELKLKELS